MPMRELQKNLDKLIAFAQEIRKLREEILNLQEKCDTNYEKIDRLLEKTAEKEKLLVDARLKISKEQLFVMFNKKKKEELEAQLLALDMSDVIVDNSKKATEEAMALPDKDITEFELQTSYAQKRFETLLVDWRVKPANKGNFSFTPDVFDRITLGQLVDDDEVEKAAEASAKIVADAAAAKKAKEDAAKQVADAAAAKKAAEANAAKLVADAAVAKKAADKQAKAEFDAAIKAIEEADAAAAKAIEVSKRNYAIQPITLPKNSYKYTRREVYHAIGIIEKKVVAEASVCKHASDGNNSPIVNLKSVLLIIPNGILRLTFEFTCVFALAPSVVSNPEGQLQHTKSCKYVLHCMIDNWQQISIYNYDNKDVIKNDSLDDKHFLNTIFQSLISNILRAFNINESLI